MRDSARAPSPSHCGTWPSGPPPVDAWTAGRVPDLVAHRLGGNALLLVSNREPYLHEHDRYNPNGTAERLGAALSMPEPPRRQRMTRRRERVLQSNIYRWPGATLDIVRRRPDPEVIS